MLLALDRVLSILLVFSLQTVSIGNCELAVSKFEEFHDFGNGCRFQTVVKSFSAFMKLRTGISTSTYSKAYLAVAWGRDINFTVTRDCRSVAWQTVRRSRPVSSDIWGMHRCMHKSFCSSPSVSGHYEPTCGAYAVQFI